MGDSSSAAPTVWPPPPRLRSFQRTEAANGKSEPPMVRPKLMSAVLCSSTVTTTSIKPAALPGGVSGGHGGKVLGVVEVAQPLQDLGLVEHVAHLERQLTQQHVVLGLFIAAENDVLDVRAIGLPSDDAERYGACLLIALFDQLDDIEDVTVLEVVVLDAGEVLLDEGRG